MLYDLAHRFMSEEIAPRYDQFEKNEMVDRDAWTKAGTAGLLCASMPEEYGGSGGTFAHESAIIEAISHVGVDGFGIALHNSIVAPYILHYGSEEQKKMAADMVLAGDKPAICITEPDAGSDANGMTTRADKKGNRYLINGRKHWITGGGVSRLPTRHGVDVAGIGDHHGVLAQGVELIGHRRLAYPVQGGNGPSLREVAVVVF